MHFCSEQCFCWSGQLRSIAMTLISLISASQKFRKLLLHIQTVLNF